ncbi:MAG TPA: cytochrome c, partial [Nitrospira sp.]|nr:cytochrome c [Nitrospira sp.]
EGGRLPALAKAVACAMALVPLGWTSSALGSDAEVLRPRVPPQLIEEVRNWTNPLEATNANIEKGKALFLGKAFCATCHGRDGRGLGDIQGLRGKLPRNFTDQIWQAARTDGELLWILKNGSPGTDMAPFVPLVLTEEEAWQVLLFVRSLGK